MSAVWRSACTRPTRSPRRPTAPRSRRPAIRRSRISRGAASTPPRSSASGSASRPTAGISWRSACARRGVAAELAERAGILAARPSGGHYDRLRGRVIFPIRDTRGRILGFGGRALGARPGAEVPEHAREPDLPQARGLLRLSDGARSDSPGRARGRRRGLLRSDRAAPRRCRGGARHLRHGAQRRACARPAAAHEAGGAALRRRRGRTARDARARSRCCCPRGCACARRCCPRAKIPTASCVAPEPSALRSLVDQAAPALDRVIERALAQGSATPAAKADAVAAVAPLLALIPSPVERAGFEQQLALSVGVEVRHVEAAVRAAQRGQDPRDAVPDHGAPSGARRAQHRAAVALPDRASRARRSRSQRGDRDARRGRTAARAARGARRRRRRRGRASISKRCCARLEPPARSLLRSLAAGDDAPSEAAAPRTIDDTLALLRKRSLRRKGRR